MSSEEQEEQNGKESSAEEAQAAFKTVKIFSSFEEEAEYTAKQRAELSHGERLRHVEILRKHVFGKHLKEDGTWPEISRKFKIIEPRTDDAGK